MSKLRAPRNGSLLQPQERRDTPRATDSAIFGATTDEMYATVASDGSVEIGSFKITPVGLIVNEGASAEDWERVGSVINRFHVSFLWLLGDWLNSGKWVYGETYKEVAAKYGYKEKTMRDYAWLCGKVDLSIRIDKPKFFTHHQLIAKFDNTDLQGAWLRYAVAADLRRKQMAELVAIIKDQSTDWQIQWLEYGITNGLNFAQMRDELVKAVDYNPPPLSDVPALLDRKNKRVFNRIWRNLEKNEPIRKADIEHMKKWLAELERG